MNTFDRIQRLALLAKKISIEFPNQSVFSIREIIPIAKENGLTVGAIEDWMKTAPSPKFGKYDMSGIIAQAGGVAVSNITPIAAAVAAPVAAAQVAPTVKSVQTITSEDVYIPEIDPCYVAWGNSKDINQIVASKTFFPIYVSGLSGNGKTMMVEQACAKLKREYVRVQINPQTDEDDLLGGFRLINGETVFADGPVIKAMRSGAILLLDEIDRGSNKIMALQGVLEGKPVLVKKTGEVVTPAKGFNVIATGNTKGRGSEDGRFISATIMDEAFLERFSITINQPYPTVAIERKILSLHMSKFDCVDEHFAEKLVIWSDTIRKTYDDGGVEELITTRRLCQIAQTYAIFRDREKSIELCINRFDDDVKEGFLDLYSKVDATIQEAREAKEAEELAAQKSADSRSEGIDQAIADSFFN